jgi:hypothetical protein
MPDEYGNPLPGEEQETALGGAEATATADPPPQDPLNAEDGSWGMPDLEIPLTDPTPKLEQGQERLDQVTEGALEDLQNAPIKDTPLYERVDAGELLGGSGIREGSSYITPEGTVAGQLEKLLASDSEYMKTAERRAKEQAASLGLAGSSMAVGAAHRAAIESGLPIAQQDAKTFASAQLEEQKAYNDISKKKAESDLSGAAREHMYDIDIAKAEAQATFQQIMDNAKMQGNMAMETTMLQIKGQWEAETQAALKNHEAKLTMMMEQQKISANERQYASQQASQIMAAAYGTISELMGNADFMAGYADSPDKLTDVFNNFISLAQNQVEFIGATAGLGDEYFQGGGFADLIGSWETDLGGYTPVEG